MGRLNWFLSGSFVGGLLVLNQVYENEQLKFQINQELETSQRIQNFVRIYTFIYFVLFRLWSNY